MIDPSIKEQMQRDWDDRAREDAHFYVAFGRRQQDPEEFFATAADVVQGLDRELRRFPDHVNRRSWRALEIGCGPGRLMKPMSSRFGEIHGVDVSGEMIQRARANLAGIPHAHVHHTSGTDLASFADESFDFVYSYAVFQHIPSREVVIQYLREACRVLKFGGLLRVQINGLDPSIDRYNTWSGVRMSAEEVSAFALEEGMQLLALEGMRTQYMWTTMRKPAPFHLSEQTTTVVRIRRITNAHTSEPVVPESGRFAVISVWVEGLPVNSHLNTVRVTIDGKGGTASYIGPVERDGLQQLNVLLPPIGRTGLVPVEVFENSRSVCEPALLRVIPAGPEVPVVLSVSDGINLLSGTVITSGTVKVNIEEAKSPQTFAAKLDGVDVGHCDVFCVDPLPPRHEINFQLPAGTTPGTHRLEMRLGKRQLGSVALEVGT